MSRWTSQIRSSSLPVIFGTALLIYGCSLKPVDTAKIRLEIEPRTPLSDAHLPYDFASAPSSITDMSCLMLNVMARDIQPLKAISRDVDYNADVQFPKLLAGDPCASYAGIISRFAPISNGGTVEVLVPVGKDRLVQILGAKTASNFGCPAETYVDSLNRLGKSTLESYVPDLFEVGRNQIIALRGDINVAISNTYSSANPKQVTNCGGDGNGGGTHTIATDDLVLWLGSDTLPNPGASIIPWPNEVTGSNPMPGPSPSSAAPTVVAGPPRAASFLSSNGQSLFSNTDNGHFANKSRYTIVAAVNIGAYPGSPEAIFELSLSPNYRGLYVVYNSPDSSLHLKYSNSASVAGGNSSGYMLIPATAPNAGFVIISIVMNASDIKVHYNGVEYTSTDAPQTLSNFVGLSIGSSIQTSSHFYNGKIGDLLFYETDLLPNSIRDTECALGAKWGVSMSGC